MKITPVILLVVLLSLLATSSVQAQTTEKIAFYADRAGTDCSISDTGVGTAIVYVFHEGTGTGTRRGCEFRAPVPDCWTGATFVGEGWNGQVVIAIAGGTQGPYISVAYSDCLRLPLYLGKLVFEVTGDAQDCCRYPVLPSVYYQSVVTADCSIIPVVPILGGSVVINENASCPCAPPLAVESMTWGRVKSLYN